MAKYALFTEDSREGASLLINAEAVRLIRELPMHGTEPATQIVFDQRHSVAVKSDLKSAWSALTDTELPED
jgi:hypothetical protein